MTQIGEFSFILASLGLTTGAIDQSLYPMAVAIFFITSLTTPLFVRQSSAIAAWVEIRTPVVLFDHLSKYRGLLQRSNSHSEWRFFLRQQAINIFLLVVGTTAITLGISYGSRKFLFISGPTDLAQNIMLFFMTAVLSSPLLWGLVWGTQKSPFTQELWRHKSYRGPIFVVITLRAFLAAFLLLIAFAQYFQIRLSFALGSTVIISILWVFSRSFERYYRVISSHFLSKIQDHLHTKKEEDLPLLTPWDIQLVPITLSAHSIFVGHTLLEAGIRERFGVTVAMIERQGRKIRAPEPSLVIFPGDCLHCLGDEEQIESLRANAEISPDKAKEIETQLTLTSVRVGPRSAVAGKSIKDSGLREELSALIIGVERENFRIINPEADFVFQLNDLVWLVADKSRLRSGII